jgi:hypothetical protein
MSKQSFIKELETFLLANCSDGFRDGRLEKLSLSEDENILYVHFPGDYIKVINIQFDSNFAIIKDLCRQIEDAPIITFKEMR